MTKKMITQADRELHSQICTRSRQLRAQGVPHPNLAAMEEFTSQAIALGWDSPNQLYGAISADGRREPRYVRAKAKATFKAYSDTKMIATKAITNGLTTAIDSYRKLVCEGDDHFVMDDEKLAPLIGCRVVTVARMRSKLKKEGFDYRRVEHGYVFTLPILSVPPATNGVEAQLPLPAENLLQLPAVEPVATTVTGTLEEVPEVALVVTESDMAVVVKKLAHIEALLERNNELVASTVVLLTDLYVQNGRHHEASTSEQRQLRALTAQQLSKWS